MLSKEKKLQKQIIQYLREKGGYVVKTIVTTRAGVPDIICCYKGKFIGIEVKGDTVATPLQQYNLQQIRSAGGVAFIINNFEEFQTLFKII